MIAGARRLPTQHLSIRVPWHDSGWNGTVCAKPASNTACRSLAPLSSSGARVIVVLVRSVGEHVEYEYTTPIEQAPLRGVLWERNVEHSIRPGFEDGFLFRYPKTSVSLRPRINSPNLCARKR